MANWQLWDRIRVFLRRGNVFRAEPLFQDQTSLERIIAGGEFLDFSRQNAILQQTNLQINRLERYKDFDQMGETGEISLALDMYADESSQNDPEQKHVITVKAASRRVKEELEFLFYDALLIDKELRPLMRYLCKYGDFAAEVVPGKNRDMVSGIRFMNIYNFTRVETRFGDLIGFFYQDPFNPNPQFLHPWQVIHMRLTSYENIYHPYGVSILDGARKDFKRLRLMEDAALVYRITRAPERRVFGIPVGNIPPKEVPLYIEAIARQIKKRPFVDPATGRMNERWSPLIQEDDYFLPRRPDGTGPTVDTLPGAQNLDQIADIEYFKKKMIAALKIPYSKVGIGDPSELDGKSLSQVSPEFAKSIQWIQREVAIGLKKIAIIHLALKGFPIDEIKNFDIIMTVASAIDELYRIETWNSRTDVIANLKETGMFPDKWILKKFTDLTDEEIEEIQKEQSGDVVAPEVGGGGEQELELNVPGGGLLPGPGGAELAPESEEKEQKLIAEYKDIVEGKHLNGKERYGPALTKLLTDNELDGLPSSNGKGILVQIHVDEEESEEAKEDNEAVLLGLDD